MGNCISGYWVVFKFQVMEIFCLSCTPRMQALLSYLVLYRNSPQSRQYLAFRFWPDSSEKQARTNLRQLLHHLRNSLPKPEPLNENWQRNQFFEALTKAFHISNKSKIIFLDDLQWCDRETLEWLGYLINAGKGRHLLVIGTLHPVEGAANATLQELLTDLRGSDKIKEIHLKGLNKKESMELAAGVAGGRKSLHPDIFGESEGNPLFVVEFVRQSHFKKSGAGLMKQDPVADSEMNASSENPPVPPKIFEVISARIEQLDENTREFIWLAAAIGREFNFRLLAEASGQEEPAAFRARERLDSARFLRNCLRSYSAWLGLSSPDACIRSISEMRA